MYEFHIQAHDYVDKLIRDNKFPCILGQTAVRTDQISFSAYDDITDYKVAEGVLHDVIRFQQEFEVPDKEKGPGGIFRSALAAFKTPQIKNTVCREALCI